MKITVDIDLTPEEARQFLGLPNVERLQDQMLANAQDFLRESGQTQVAEMVAAAAQPMLAYQAWLQKMFNPTRDQQAESDKD